MEKSQAAVQRLRSVLRLSGNWVLCRSWVCIHVPVVEEGVQTSAPVGSRQALGRFEEV